MLLELKIDMLKCKDLAFIFVYLSPPRKKGQTQRNPTTTPPSHT